MTKKMLRISGCLILIFALLVQTAVFAAEEVKQPEGTTDNDIYGLDNTDQYTRDEITTESINLSFNDIADIELAKKAEFLIKMGFVTVSDGKFRPKDDFTRYDMSYALQMITNMGSYTSDAVFNDVKPDDERISALAYAYDNGYLSRFNDYTIRPDAPVSTKELLYSMLGIMGFEENVNAVNQTGTDGIYKTAKSNKLLEGITYGNSNVSRAEAVEFLYNAITQPVNGAIAVLHRREANNYELKYENDEDETLLSVYHSIHKGEGKVNATPVSSIGDYSAAAKGQLIIDDDKYIYTDVSMLDFFGYNTEFFYKQDGTQKNKGELVYMLKNKSVKEIIIPSDEIVSYKNNVLTYYEKGNKKTAQTIASFEFIKNGKSVKDCLPEEVLPKNGTVTLAANKGGSKYDTMIVWEYYNAVAEGISANGSVLKLAFEHGASTLEYDIDDVLIDMFDGSKRMATKIETSYYYDGDGIKQVRVSLPAVPAKSVLSIFADETEERNGKLTASKDALYVRIVVNSESVDGTITAMGGKSGNNTDNMYISSQINDKTVVKKYEVSTDNFLSESDRNLEVGTTGKFYLDYLGKVAACSISDGDGDMHYGYLINADVDGGLSSKLSLKVLTENDEILLLDAVKKVKINGTAVKDPDTALGKLKDSAKLLNSSFTISQLIKYTQNTDGLISKIETVTASLGVGDGYDDNHLRRENEVKNMVYQTGWGNAFVEYEYTDYKEHDGEQKNIRLEMTHYIGKPKVFFCVPETETFDDDKLFSAGDKWPSESTEMLPTELYDVSKTMAPGIAVVYAKMQNSYLAKPIMVVDRIFYKSDSDGDLKKWISGYGGAGGYIEYPAEKESVLENVRIGDIIFASGRNNEIYDIEKIGNAIDIAKMDISEAPLMVKSKNKAPETEFFLYTTLYEAYDFSADTKTLMLQRGNIIEGAKREYQRTSWWVNEWRKWGGAVTVEVDVDKDEAWIKNGTYGDLKNAYDYSNEEASKIVLIETYGYGMRFIVIINKV